MCAYYQVLTECTRQTLMNLSVEKRRKTGGWVIYGRDVFPVGVSRVQLEHSNVILHHKIGIKRHMLHHRSCAASCAKGLAL